MAELANDPQTLFAVGGALLIALVWLATRGGGERMRDPKRAFDANQRRLGFERCEHRCEFGLLWRCRAAAHHGDHFLPWSKGGATSMRNFVGACGWHNVTKAARMPSGLQRLAIEVRRKRYFPTYEDHGAGEWMARR